ncbi:hypothetical protein N7504_006361 [Penicillium tannophilum]|nr:hypothetical protein N7504_006361 [Penicillium tannophilum]
MSTLCILKEVDSFGTCVREDADHLAAIEKVFETIQDGRQIGDFEKYIHTLYTVCHETYDGAYNYAYYARTIGMDVPASECRQFLISTGANFTDALVAIAQAGGDICQPSQ